jgi:hypothetical protein
LEVGGFPWPGGRSSGFNMRGKFTPVFFHKLPFHLLCKLSTPLNLSLMGTLQVTIGRLNGAADTSGIFAFS